MSWYKIKKIATVFDQIQKTLMDPDSFPPQVIKAQIANYTGILDTFSARSTDSYSINLVAYLPQIIQSLKNSQNAALLATDLAMLEAYMSDPDIQQILQEQPL